jgi:hypothetical protein
MILLRTDDRASPTRAGGRSGTDTQGASRPSINPLMRFPDPPIVATDQHTRRGGNGTVIMKRCIDRLSTTCHGRSLASLSGGGHADPRGSPRQFGQVGQEQGLERRASKSDQ